MEVEYRPCGKHGYRVGSDGSVWTCWRKGPGATPDGQWRQLKVRLDHEGYRRVTFRDGTSAKACVLVLTAFAGPCPPGHECCHGPDNNPANDSIDNLRWGTHAENIADKKLHGTMACGERHGRAKLSDAEIAEIRALKGSATQITIAERFGVSRGYVGQLWSGQRTRLL
jgi:hypothetical protein